jgi:very-short-patch-repair endonuclease
LSARALLAGCEWLASHGGFAVWLAGAGRADGLADGTGRADGLTGGAGSGGEVPTRRPGRVTIRFPALAGRPHPASRAEQALEAALVEQPWAAGRSWNQTYQPDPLTGQIRVDLMWQDERCAVEIDGPEHHAAWHYEADRRRDVLLQLAGFAVLRFTNAQIDHDLRLVLSHIEALLTIRRSGKD